MNNILYQIVREEDKHLLNKSGVYQIKNKENNKVYIGSTSKKFSHRLSNHIRELLENKHHSKHLQNSFNKDKKFDRFEISILEVCDPENCIPNEQKWIDIYTPYKDTLGYNISPTAGSCLGIKKSKEDKIKIFERLRKLKDDEIIEIFYCRNNLKIDNNEISERIGITKNQVASILNKEDKYMYVKEKYDLKLEIKHEKKFTKEDIKIIHELYENQKLSIKDILSITSYEVTPLKHVIYNENLYKEEKNGLVFNVENHRKNKIYKIVRKKGYKINKNILKEETIYDVFELKYNSSVNNKDISEKLQIKLKEVDLILTFRYQRRKYNQIYLDIKTKYRLRQNKITLSEEDIKNIFEDYNSGEYLIEDLNKKYNFNDVGIILSNSKRLSENYKEIIDKNNLIVNKSRSKNRELKSTSITERNKSRSKTYKLITPDGEELIVKNLSEFCKDKELDPANLSRISKNGKLYKKWRCICLSD
jgi:group I intron endonuclease